MSKPALNYLHSKELMDAFCGKCDYNKYYQGYFNPLSGIVDPPFNSCPAAFGIGCNECKQRSRFLDVVDLLIELDNCAELEKTETVVVGN
jgi:hypothetical protein